MKVMKMQQIQTQILIPKLLIDPVSAVNEINEAAARNEHAILRIFYTRSKKNVFTLQKGSSKFLFRDPKFISCIQKDEAINLLFRLNEKIRTSRFLDFEIISEQLNESN